MLTTYKTLRTIDVNTTLTCKFLANTVGKIIFGVDVF